MKLFGRNKKEEKIKTREEAPGVSTKEKTPVTGVAGFSANYGVLKGFYVSEKSSLLNSLNQYVFKVFDSVTKNEIKKQVEKSFSVKVKGVKIINLPKKSRTVGRHTGFKRGSKKAIVVLKEGYSIDQAKA